MTLADGFLAHARELASQPAALDEMTRRRIVTASYYALFHQIIQDAADLIGPNVSIEINHRIQRWFDHSAMKQICGRFTKPRLDQPLNGLVGDSASPELEAVCSTFIELQERRHDADYNPRYVIAENDALQHWASAMMAVDAWKRIRATSEANVFILSLLLWKNWEKDR